MDADADAVGRLTEIGFSQYEAQAYLGLLGREPMTGYALANLTGIPQPKVYETLRRLSRKGVAVPVQGDAKRFVAIPTSQLISQLDQDFRRRLADAEIGLMRVGGEDRNKEVRVLDVTRDWPSIQAQAIALLDSAERHVYISLHCDEPTPILDAINRIDKRGVLTDMLLFGNAPVSITHGRCVRHESTRGVVYRHHQARHLAVVVDSSKMIWALASDGTQWEQVSTDDTLLAAVVKGYVRHDIYVQQIATDFGTALTERYGPGLEGLVIPQQATDDEVPNTQQHTRQRRA
jgi:HTH-type transcriptional regulator, sugar sensing transcriptional regulator